MADVTRIEIATRPGFADSRGLSVAGAIRDPPRHLRRRRPHPRRLPRRAGPLRRRRRPRGRRVRRPDRPAGGGRPASRTAPSTWPSRSASSRASPTRSASRRGSPSRTCSAASSGAGGAVYASRVYLLSGVRRDEAARIATQLLANEVIERVTVQPFAEWQASAPDLSVPRVVEHPPRPAETVRLRGLDDAALARLSREKLLALTVEELRTLRDFFEQAAADPAARQGRARRRPDRRRAGVPRPDLVGALQAQDLQRHHHLPRGGQGARGDPLDLQAVHPRHHRAPSTPPSRRARGRAGWSRSSTTTPASSPPPTATTWSTRWRPTTARRRSTRTAAPSPASSASTAIPSAPGWAPTCSPTSGATASARPAGPASSRPACSTRAASATASTTASSTAATSRASPTAAAGSSSTTASSASRWSTAAPSGACR